MCHRADSGLRGVTALQSSGAAVQQRSGVAAQRRTTDKNTAIAQRSGVAAQRRKTIQRPQNARAAQRRSGDKNKAIAQRSGVAKQRRSGSRQFKDTNRNHAEKVFHWDDANLTLCSSAAEPIVMFV